MGSGRVGPSGSCCFHQNELYPHRHRQGRRRSVASVRAFDGNRTRSGLAVLCVAQFVVVLDATAVTGALPALGRELGFTAGGLQWVVTAYTLTFGGFLIVGGRVADLVGSRRAFAVGLLGFTAASLCCGLASSPALLIVSRVAQGAAAALLSPAALAMLTVITRAGQERERAVGIWTAAAAGGGAAGWVLGGLLTDSLGWRWVFLVNLPIGLAALPLIALVLPRQPARRGARLDAAGAVGRHAGPGADRVRHDRGDRDRRRAPARRAAAADRRGDHDRCGAARAPRGRSPAPARVAGHCRSPRGESSRRVDHRVHHTGDVLGRALRAERSRPLGRASSPVLPRSEPHRDRRIPHRSPTHHPHRTKVVGDRAAWDSSRSALWP